MLHREGTSPRTRAADDDGPPLSLVALGVFVALLLGGCSQRQGPPPECVTLQGHAIQHATLYDAHHGTGAESTPFRAVYDGALIQTPAWVAAPRYDSRQVRDGRRTWWLASKPDSTTDTMAAWEVAR